jgi:GTPase SAR1 family protein
VNLDPACPDPPYPCALSIADLVTVPDVMEEFSLGPNGALLYCLEYLEANVDWLIEELAKFGKDAYVVLDMPGQVELSTDHGSLKRIVDKLQKADWRVSYSSVCRLLVGWLG